MTRDEARRFAHLLAAQSIQQLTTTGYGTDGPAIMRALAGLAEQHMRYGPKSTDRAPNQTKPVSTPLLDSIGDPDGAI